MIQILTTVQRPWTFHARYPETRDKWWDAELEVGNIYLRFVSFEVTIIWSIL